MAFVLMCVPPMAKAFRESPKGILPPNPAGCDLANVWAGAAAGIGYLRFCPSGNNAAPLYWPRHCHRNPLRGSDHQVYAYRRPCWRI